MLEVYIQEVAALTIWHDLSTQSRERIQTLADVCSACVLEEIVIRIDTNVVSHGCTTCVLPGVREGATALTRMPGEAFDHPLSQQRTVLE